MPLFRSLDVAVFFWEKCIDICRGPTYLSCYSCWYNYSVFSSALRCYRIMEHSWAKKHSLHFTMVGFLCYSDVKNNKITTTAITTTAICQMLLSKATNKNNYGLNRGEGKKLFEVDWCHFIHWNRKENFSILMCTGDKHQKRKLYYGTFWVNELNRGRHLSGVFNHSILSTLPLNYSSGAGWWSLMKER